MAGPEQTKFLTSSPIDSGLNIIYSHLATVRKEEILFLRRESTPTCGPSPKLVKGNVDGNAIKKLFKDRVNYVKK